MEDKQRAAFEAWYESAIWGNEDFKSSLGIAYTQGFQAALASPEVQAWKKDAERYRWLRNPCSGAERVIFYSRGDYGKGLMPGEMLDEAIDAAMEKQK